MSELHFYTLVYTYKLSPIINVVPVCRSVNKQLQGTPKAGPLCYKPTLYLLLKRNNSV